MSITTEFTVVARDRLAGITDVAGALGAARINIDGLQATPFEGRVFIQLVVDDPAGAYQALDSAGVHYTTREVLVLTLVDEPGALAHVTRTLAESGIAVDAVYVTMTGRVVFGVSDLAEASRVATSLGAE